MRSFAQALSHLALWPGLYVASAVCFVVLIAARPAVHDTAWLLAVPFAACTAAAAYLLDRVALRDSLVDPAEAAANPRRTAFLAPHRRLIRLVSLALLIAATAIAALVSPALLPVPWLSALGVIAYTARPRLMPRAVKDLLLVKNAYVAGGIAGFAAVIAAAVFPGRSLAILIAALPLAVRVFADAALCDLDDEAGDRRAGTATLATAFGRRAALNLATSLRAVAALMVVTLPLGPSGPRLLWAGAGLVGIALIRLASPLKIRDWIDLDLPAEVFVVAAVQLV